VSLRKNRVYSKVLADVAMNRRTQLNRDFFAICGEDEMVAEALRAEVKLVLAEMLRGDFQCVNQKLAEHTRRSPQVALRRAPERTVRRTIRIGETSALLDIMLMEEEPEESIYGVLRRSLETGDIKHLSLCQTCAAVFFRKSLKGRFCNIIADGHISIIQTNGIVVMQSF
jgi:hypothetical protein